MGEGEDAAGCAISVSDLQVARGGHEVLRGISLTVATGRVTGLIGPSGCGKTTLMRAVVGTQIVRSGRVEVLGVPAGSAALRTRVGYSSQGASVYSDLTVAENFRYFADVLGAAKSDVSRILTTVDLEDYADQVTATLSGGQRSRVSLGVALLGRPELLVLDEPTVGLDPLLREHLWQLFAQLASEGITLLVSSHVMDEAERCDELVLMRSGQILTHESPAELKRRTGTADVGAAFLHLIQGESAQ